MYRILQIVRGGKVLRLQNSTVICWKTFTVGPSRVTNFQSLIVSTRKEGFAEQRSWNNQSTTKSTILFIFCLTWPCMWPHVYIGMTTNLTMSVVDEFVVSEDIMYTKTHGHQLLVNNLYAEEKTAINATDIYLYNTILQLIIWEKIFISPEKFRNNQLIHENYKTFSTSNNLQYTVLPYLKTRHLCVLL